MDVVPRGLDKKFGGSRLHPAGMDMPNVSSGNPCREALRTGMDKFDGVFHGHSPEANLRPTEGGSFALDQGRILSW